MVLLENIGYLLLSLLGITRSPETFSTEDNPSHYKVVCVLMFDSPRFSDTEPWSKIGFDPFLCTHAIYVIPSFLNSQIEPLNIYEGLKDSGENSFEGFQSLKKMNPNLKTFLSVTNPTNSSLEFDMVADPAARAKFIFATTSLCRFLKLNGIDLYWQNTPKKDHDAKQHKQNFVTLLKEFKEAFAPHGLILSATLSANKNVIDTLYDIPGVSKYLDFINVEAYDFHGYWENKTGHTAPLYSGSDGSESDKISTVDYAINYWIKNGAPRSKLNLGMALYGRSFTLSNTTNNGIGASTIGPGQKGPIRKETGLLGYNEICSDEGWTEVFDETIKVPYAYKGNQWVGYENVKSIEIKVDYLIQEGLAGGMVWLLDDDDYKGSCGGGKFPLLTTVASKLRKERPTPKPEFKCTKTGYFRDPSDCSVFYHCTSLGRNDFHKDTLKCPAGLAYDETLHICNWRNKVPGCE